MAWRAELPRAARELGAVRGTRAGGEAAHERASLEEHPSPQ